MWVPVPGLLPYLVSMTAFLVPPGSPPACGMACAMGRKVLPHPLNRTHPPMESKKKTRVVRGRIRRQFSAECGSAWGNSYCSSSGAQSEIKGNRRLRSAVQEVKNDCDCSRKRQAHAKKLES